MSAFEIVGIIVCYIVAVAAVGYIALAIGAFIWRNGGLEAIPKIMVGPILIWFCGAMGGLVLLGRLFA
ncbi:hypothetical protein B1VFA_152 [Rhizobium phage B1VFA]|nr:hypothetical protein B1VFA_152 [Rhizobium phage B1VFA]